MASIEVFITNIQIRSEWRVFMHKEICDPDLRLKSVINVRRTNVPRTGDDVSGPWPETGHCVSIVHVKHG